MSNASWNSTSSMQPTASHRTVAQVAPPPITKNITVKGVLEVHRYIQETAAVLRTENNRMDAALEFAGFIMTNQYMWRLASSLIRELRELPEGASLAIQLLWNLTLEYRDPVIEHPDPSDRQIRLLRLHEAETLMRFKFGLPNPTEGQSRLMQTISDAWSELMEIPALESDHANSQHHKVSESGRNVPSASPAPAKRCLEDSARKTDYSIRSKRLRRSS